MYDELIKRLRASCESCKLWDGYKCCLKGECSAQKSLQAADVIERLDAIAQTYAETVHEIEDKRKWIPVTERLPEKDQTVLAYCAEDNFCYISRRHQSFEDYDVTHWIPLPQMPESDGE